MPSSAAVREIMGPAGSDMTMFPPTVASFQILKEARNARQHSGKSGAAFHSGVALKRSSSTTLQVAAISNPSGEMDGEGHLNDSRSMSVCVLTCGSENNQVPPASQAYPFSHFLTASASAGRSTSVIVLRSINRGLVIAKAFAVSKLRRSPFQSLSIRHFRGAAVVGFNDPLHVHRDDLAVSHDDLAVDYGVFGALRSAEKCSCHRIM